MSSALPVVRRQATPKQERRSPIQKNLFLFQLQRANAQRAFHQITRNGSGEITPAPGTTTMIMLGRYSAEAPKARPSFLKITRQNDGLFWATPENGRNEWGEESFPLFPNEQINVGRARDQSVRFDNPIVSGEHLSLTVEVNSKIWVTDNGSSNGTYAARVDETPSPRHYAPDSFAEGLVVPSSGINLSLSDGQNAQLLLGETPAILYRQNGQTFVRVVGQGPQRLNVGTTRISGYLSLSVSCDAANNKTLFALYSDSEGGARLMAAPRSAELRTSGAANLSFSPPVEQINPLSAKINLNEIENYAEGDLIAQQQVEISYYDRHYTSRNYTLSLLNGIPVLTWQEMGATRNLAMVNGFINSGAIRIMRMDNGKIRIGRTPAALLNPEAANSILYHSLRPNDMLIVKIPGDEYVVTRSAELYEDDVATYRIKCLTLNGLADNRVTEINEGEQKFGNLLVQRIEVGGQPGFRILPLQNNPLPGPGLEG